MRWIVVHALMICCGITSAQDWKNVGNCGTGLNCGPQCQRLCLIQHNYYRSLHNSPPLKCDPKLAESAQSWANSNARQETVQRSTPTKDYAESISWKRWGWKGMGTKLEAIPGAVRSWYSELKRGYDYNTGEAKGMVTHFKSVVHAREARLGCGINIKPGDGTYVVAHYSLGAGEKFKLNDFSPLNDVGIRKQPEPQCHLKSFEREQCGELKSQIMTPDRCIKAGCCYDDMFMDEPELQWYNQNASIWCFKRKSGIATVPGASSDAQAPGKLGNGKILAQPQASLPNGNQGQKLQIKMSAAGTIQGQQPCSAATEALTKVIALIDTVTKVTASKGCGQGATTQPGPQQPTKPPAPPLGPTTAPPLSPTTPPGSTTASPGSSTAQPGPTTAPPGSTTAPPGSTTAPPGSTAVPTSGATTPTQPGAGGTQDMTGFEKDCLQSHNEYRAKHGVPPLKWSAELAADAQKWADQLAIKNTMEHDMESINNKGVGENLAYFQPGGDMPTQCQGPKTPTCVQCREMVADWYAEESNFDYNTGQSKGGVILHFTQVVWKETTELGMATATSANKWFSVARYKPRGNMGFPEDYKKNVPRPQ